MSNVGKMFQQEGVVSAVYQDSTKKPGVFRRSFSLSDAKGVYYRCGIKDPKINKGDMVSFVYTVGEYNGKEQFDVEVQGLRVTTKAPAPQQAASPQQAPPAAAPSPGFKKSNNYGARDDMDLKNRMTAWHAARAQAMEMIGIATSAKLVGFDDTADLLSATDSLAKKLYDQTVEFLLTKTGTVVETAPVVEPTLAPVTTEEGVAEVKASVTPITKPKAEGRFNF